jgi:hypothetical protein
MSLTLFFKVGTGQTGSQFLKKILFNEIGAMGPGSQPAFSMMISVGRAEHF